VFTFHSALPLAETSSTFAEMLLTDRLLAQDRDPAVRRQLIADTLDDAYATIMRQAYFTLFEQQAHALIQSGAGTDELNAAYMRSLREQFGSAVEIAPEFKWEWVSIPHIFYTPFYCYAYSFGQLLVLALYQRYKKQGARFTPHYLKILAYGGSASPQHILEEAGIDITKPSFWQGGFDFISGLLDELESGLD
jgi:oligoendopeptidase F